MANHVVECVAQTITLPQVNYTKLYLLAVASENTQGNFTVDGQSTILTIQQ